MDLRVLLIKILQVAQLIRLVEGTIKAVRQIPQVPILHNTTIPNALMNLPTLLVADAVGIKKGPPVHQAQQMEDVGTLFLMVRVV